MSYSLGDWNGDMRLDFFTTSLAGRSPHSLLLAQGDFENRRFTNNAEDANVNANATFGWGSVMQDFDNDGWNDLAYVGNLRVVGTSNSPGRVFRSTPCAGGSCTPRTQRRAELTQTLGLENENGGGMAVGDFDGDGFLDFVVNTETDAAGPVPLPNSAAGELRVFHNSGIASKNRHYIQIGLNGTESNRLGVGSLIRVFLRDCRGSQTFSPRYTKTRGGIEIGNKHGKDFAPRQWIRQVTAGSGFASTDSRFVHVGVRTVLGERDVDVHVAWSGSGRREWFRKIDLDQRLILTEGQGVPEVSATEASSSN